MLYVGTGLVLLALWLFCLIDAIATDEYRVRNMPKTIWVLIVLLVPTVGSIAWLVAGRPWDEQPRPATTGAGREFPEYDRPGRHIAQNSDEDEAFLRQVRARAEEQRQRAAEERRRREEQGLD
jgi:Phospholipase_D-nuclease N-terminal